MSVKWWEESKLYAIRKEKRIRAGQEGLSIRDKTKKEKSSIRSYNRCVVRV
jgi:hypothetical protein